MRQMGKDDNVMDTRAKWDLERLKRSVSEREQQRKKDQQRKEEQQRENKLRESKFVMNPSLSKPKLSLPLPPLMDYVQGDKKLSILICSIKGREEKLNNLLSLLEGQITGDVEILIEVDNKEITIGEKRNVLLKRARGDYIAFVDDDDLISNDYVSKILAAIETSPDCCGIEGEIDHMKVKRPESNERRRQPRHRYYRCKQKFIHSNQYTKWYQKNDIYYRCPNHLNPIKRELVGQIMFPEMSQGEDKDFSMRILPLLKTEVFIKGIIYYYRAVL